MLIEIGLSQKEEAIYKALVRLGPSLVNKIVSETQLNRTYIYDRLQKLIDKGLVSYVVKNNRKHFCVTEPERIYDYLEQEQELLNKRKIAAAKTIKELSALKSIHEETVQVYEGKEGIQTILQDMLKEKKKIYAQGSDGNFSLAFKHTFKHFLAALEKNNIKLDVLFSQKKQDFSWKNARVRYLKNQPQASETMIYGNKVVIFIFTQKPKAVMIESKAVAQNYKNIFKTLWAQSK